MVELVEQRGTQLGAGDGSYTTWQVRIDRPTHPVKRNSRAHLTGFGDDELTGLTSQLNILMQVAKKSTYLWLGIATYLGNDLASIL